MEVIKKLDNGVNSILSALIKEPTLIRGAIHLLLMLYAARIAPKLPDAVLALFENQYFKLFVFSLILWTAQFSPSTSILITIAFMVSINYVNQKPLWEFMEGDIQLLEEETTTMGPETTTMPPKTTAAIEAVVALANAAVSTTAVPAEQVIPVAEVAAAAVTTTIGLQAIQVLAEQAVTPTPAPTPEVQRAVDLAVQSITAAPQEPSIAFAPASAPASAPAPTPAPVAQKMAVPEPAPTTTASPQVPEAGCYPMRRYDMTKVSPQSGIQYGFESYQEFSA